jgi:nuclear-control-of-ATPase protein 2
MNKSNGIMSGFGLKLEESSLDHMLRDLGYGDGTAAGRLSGLQKAAEQYEHDLKTGVFVNLARGRMVKLLLVQVQQLKVGVLSALDTIDVLLKGNQIHFQFLAAIPAVIIATFGTRFFLRFLYSIRSKDLRPVTVAHANMASYLSHVERLILLAEPVAAIETSSSSSSQKAASARHRLPHATLGEVSLYMYRYLTLLEFSSPLFPASATEQIHMSLQGLLGTTLRQDGSAELTLRWLDRIQGQHRELLKHT